MKPFSEISADPLEWREPKALEQHYELYQGDEIFATLIFKTAFGSLATAETTECKWTFKRVGFLNPRVTVRELGSDGNLAVFQPRFWGDGELILTSGERFTWKPTNFWQTEWVFQDTYDRLWVKFKSGTEKSKLSDLFKTQAMLEIAPVIPARETLPLLVTVGWYLMILHQQDAAAAATVASTM
jgi:hypothetical protein